MPKYDTVLLLLSITLLILALNAVVPRLWNWYFALDKCEGEILNIFDSDGCIIVHFKMGAIVIPTEQEPLFQHFKDMGENVHYRLYPHRRTKDLPRGGLL